MTLLKSARAAACLLTLVGCVSRPVMIDGQASIAAVMETAPAGSQGDAADDPAIWAHPAEPGAARLLGTNKQRGLVVYGLDGVLLQDLPIGRLNNIDLRRTLSGAGDIAIASNDQTNAISVFRIDRATGTVSHAGDIATGKAEPYGICSGRVGADDLAGVTYKDGTVQVWTIAASAGPPAARAQSVMKLATKLEGCVFDEVNDTLFIGEEQTGIWTFKLSDMAAPPVLIDEIGSASGLVGDTEGLSIWRGKDGAGWLVASAQAADRFVVYDRKSPHRVRGSFSVTANAARGIDKVTHTDGLDVYSGALPGYPRGMLMVQDDGNPATGQDQNFKTVDWADVEAALNLPLLAAE
jgi:3-phytase